MKKILALTLAAVMALGLLAGCGEQNTPSPTQAPVNTHAPTPAPTAAPAASRTELYKNAIIAARTEEDNEFRPITTELTEDDEYLLMVLGELSFDDISECALSVSLMMVQAYGVAAIYPAEGKTETVMNGLRTFINNQKQNFDKYLMDQYEIADSAKLETLSDGTVLLVMCEDQDQVFESIKTAIESAR